MRTVQLRIDDGGPPLAALLRLPDDDHDRRLPTVVHGPGWLGRAAAPHYERFHEAFTRRGFAVLAFDHQGYVPPAGAAGWIDPEEQIRDTIRAVDRASADQRLDPERIGLYGVGATGGGNAVCVAARDPRIRWAVAYHVIGDGQDWLRRMRTPAEWASFVARIAADRRRRERGEEGETVDPRTDLMVAGAERAANAAKRDLDALLPARFELRSADALLRYRPLAEAERASRLLVSVVAGDAVTPEDHAVALYERAREPKRLLRLHGTSHYEANTRCIGILAREFTGWAEACLGREPPTGATVVEHDAALPAA